MVDENHYKISEWFSDILELVYNVDKIIRVHDRLDQLSRWRILIITLCPIVPETVSLILGKVSSYTVIEVPSMPRMTQSQQLLAE